MLLHEEFREEPWLNRVMTDMYKKMQKDKEDLITTKFKEKGFGHLIPSMGKARFAKIAIESHLGWDYVFADDGTELGCFIVAIKNFEYSMPEMGEDMSYKMTMTSQWQDRNYPEALDFRFGHKY